MTVTYTGFRLRSGVPVVTRTQWLPAALRPQNEPILVGQGGSLKLGTSVVHCADRLGWGEDALLPECEQLAVALLVDYRDADFARQWYVELARALVIELPESWRLSTDDLTEILSLMGAPVDPAPVGGRA